MLREQALRQLRKRRDFKTHLTAYLVVNAALWTISAVLGVVSEAWWPWPIFPTVGWGIGLVLNAWDVYVRRPIREEDIRREMRRLGETS